MLPTEKEDRGIDSSSAAVAFPLGIALLVRLFLLVDLPREAVSFDLKAWVEVAAALDRNENPYQVLPYLSWAPFWMQLVFGLQKITGTLGWELITTIRLFLILVDAGILLVLDGMFRTIFPTPRRTWILLYGISLNPVSFLLICQHGNFDVLVSFWVLLALWSLSRFALSRDPIDWCQGCLFLGLGVTTKTVPVVLAPLLFNRYRDLKPKARAVGWFLFLGPALYGLSILYPLAPRAVETHVLGYRSFPGWFGFTGLLHVLDAERLTGIYTKLFTAFLAVAMLAAAVHLSRRNATARQLLLLAILLLGALPALGPGYGPQYVYWILPLLVLAYGVFIGGLRRTILVFAIVAAATYLAEYALIPILGASLLHAEPSRAVLEWSMIFQDQRRLVLLRLPLLLAYLGLFTGLIHQWRKESPR